MSNPKTTTTCLRYIQHSVYLVYIYAVQYTTLSTCMGSDTNKKSDTITKRSTSSCLQIFLFVTLACFLLPFLIDVLVPSRYLEIQKMGAGKSKDALPPLKAMNKVLNSKGAQNFMGYWYVASCKPTFLEKGVHNSLE